jgi:hypothetical protein
MMDEKKWPIVTKFPGIPEVGVTYPHSTEIVFDKRLKKTVEKIVKKLFEYSHVTYNEEGWTKSNEFLPRRFELVKVKLERGGFIFPKDINGWWTGSDWTGLRFKPEDKVREWKTLYREEMS